VLSIPFRIPGECDADQVYCRHGSLSIPFRIPGGATGASGELGECGFQFLSGFQLGATKNAEETARLGQLSIPFRIPD